MLHMAVRDQFQEYNVIVKIYLAKCCIYSYIKVRLHDCIYTNQMFWPKQKWAPLFLSE